MSDASQSVQPAQMEFRRAIEYIDEVKVCRPKQPAVDFCGIKD